ncbi:MAG: hypothetical protein R2754_06760 [Microthrixaceae bacterium]
MNHDDHDVQPSDDEPGTPLLGPPPRPDSSTREASIAAALAHYDELAAQGAWGDSDELATRRSRRSARLGGAQQWLAAAAVAAVLGVGGLVVLSQRPESGTDSAARSSAEAPGQTESATNLDSSAETGAAGGAADRSEDQQPKAAAAEADGAPEAGAAVGSPAPDEAQLADEGPPTVPPGGPSVSSPPWPPWLCALFRLVGVRSC